VFVAGILDIQVRNDHDDLERFDGFAAGGLEMHALIVWQYI
jgi:hypothetical protein